MKIAVVCANGKAGKLIVKEAVERGADVTAIVRGENKSVADKEIIYKKEFLLLENKKSMLSPSIFNILYTLFILNDKINSIRY